jgi:hypothetical protein
MSWGAERGERKIRNRRQGEKGKGKGKLMTGERKTEGEKKGNDSNQRLN